jgi:hypothetical protein
MRESGTIFRPRGRTGFSFTKEIIMKEAATLPRTLITLVLCVCAVATGALELEDPQDTIFGGEAGLFFADGSMIEGEVTATPTAQNGLASVLLHGEDKRRVKAEELRGVVIRKKGVHAARPELFLAPTPRVSLSKRGKAIAKEMKVDFQVEYLKDVMPAQDERFVYRTVTVEPGEQRLLQVLNLGFDSRMKVYRRPTPLGFFDVESKSFLVVKDGGEPVLVRPAIYREVYGELFGDCELMGTYEAKQRKFSNFAEQLYMYHRFCPAPEEGGE